jgi:hypothetical protein
MDIFILFLMIGVCIVGFILCITLKATAIQAQKYGDFLVEQSKEAQQQAQQVIHACLQAQAAQGINVDKLPSEMQEVILSQIPMEDDQYFADFMNKLHKDNSDKR